MGSPSVKEVLAALQVSICSNSREFHTNSLLFYLPYLRLLASDITHLLDQETSVNAAPDLYVQLRKSRREQLKMNPCVASPELVQVIPDVSVRLLRQVIQLLVSSGTEALTLQADLQWRSETMRLMAEHISNLTPLEKELLNCLLGGGNTGVPLEILYAELYEKRGAGKNYIYTLRMLVRSLRGKLNGTGLKIETIRGFGYRMYLDESATLDA